MLQNKERWIPMQKLKQKFIEAVMKQSQKSWEKRSFKDDIEKHIRENGIEIPEDKYDLFLKNAMTFVSCEKNNFDEDEKEELITAAVAQTIESWEECGLIEKEESEEEIFR